MTAVVRCAGRLTLISGNALSKLVSKQLPCSFQAASISSKAWRELNGIKRPPPFDYRNKDYTLITSWFDKTTHRLDENSKVMACNQPLRQNDALLRKNNR